MPSAPTQLFVYGTLKRGDVRAFLLDGQACLGQARTAPRYRLFNTGDYPALVEAQPLGLAGLSIVGELWAIDDDCLARLDIEEGVDEGLYERANLDLIEPDTTVLGYLYMLPVDGMPDCGDCWDAG